MAYCSERIGEAYFRTPRNTIKSFVQLLSILEQNPGADWKTLLGEAKLEKDEDAKLEAAPGGSSSDDDLVNLKL
jgi:hypothetical protein